jgi:hypothetical protein
MQSHPRPHQESTMRATLTRKGQVTLPAPIRAAIAARAAERFIRSFAPQRRIFPTA